MQNDYNSTLNLPVTDFPMRANLPQREPALLEKWEAERAYDHLMEKNDGKPTFILHDGPPYANGDIHMGHVLNKVLKDIIVKYKNMAGFKSHYVPGWDTHGLPIERQAIKKLGINRDEVDVVKFRGVCRDFALTYVDNQREQFKRLGVWGDWDHPYITLDPQFEGKQIEVFGEMAKKGYIYKGLRPVYWCPDCETALAEAEIEYQEDPNVSIYVKFPVRDDLGKMKALLGTIDKTYFVIWTTTTWTLPGNLAIALNPEFEYALVRANGETYIIAEDLVPSAMQAAKITEYEILGRLKGEEFEYMKARHPFLDRDSLIILGEHVTKESGTGCVHTAPGHGADDFIVCQHYKELEVVVPVDGKGYLTKEAGEFAGLTYEQANGAIRKKLAGDGLLFAAEKIKHQYPHCWRCKSPILFRTTEQWFASVDKFRNEALKAIGEVTWIPKWGEERITTMVKERNDWCISRQRAWGVPLPIFYCKKCGHELITDESLAAVSALFSKEGSDAWYQKDASEILPAGTKCVSCGAEEFTKEKDIMDVWFDSGSSHAAVLELRDDLSWPCDVYLEGHDQHRGWFQSSLLTAVATKGHAPYRSVVTCGFVIDEEGSKMSKSAGNGIDPLEVMKTYGADILRLWVMSADYKTDVRISNEILKQLSEGYRKIRNTARFILGNLNGFDPDRHLLPYEELFEIDRWALMQLHELSKKVLTAYDRYEFHTVYHSLHNFCVVTMSNFYLDIIKDRLYVERADSKSRRAAQSAMYLILDSLVRMLTPAIAFTAEEIWQFMPHHAGCDARSVVYNEMQKPNPAYEDASLGEKWDRILKLRDDVKKKLELARSEKTIGASLEASVTLTANGEDLAFLQSVEEHLGSTFIVSEVKIEEGDVKEEAGYEKAFPNILVEVKKAAGEKCERCWVYSEVGQSVQHPTLCARCAKIVGE